MDREIAVPSIVTTSDTIETEVISTNSMLTLITTEDGIPTSTEVTVLTTSLGDVPIMTATLGTLSEVAHGSSNHPTFATSHAELRTVYTTSLVPSHAIAGQAVVLSNGQLAVMGADGIRRTLVVHAAGPEDIASSMTEAPSVVTVDGVDLQIQESPSEFSPATVVLTEEEASRLTQGAQVLSSIQEVSTAEVITSASDMSALVQQGIVIEASENQVRIEEPTAESNVVEENEEPAPHHPGVIKTIMTPAPVSQIEVHPDETINTLVTAKEEVSKELQKSTDEEAIPVPEVPSAIPPIPEEVICLVCYQSFQNPKTNKRAHGNNENFEGIKELTNYGRTLGKFFEISRINMSIVTRRSYKDYEVPLCQTCAEKFNQAETILEQLKQLEKRLYYLRQEIKEAIVSSHITFKKKENSEILEYRRQVVGLKELLDAVDHIREDIINDGRPPRIPRSMSGKKVGRKPKKAAVEATDQQSVPSPNSVSESKKLDIATDKAASKTDSVATEMTSLTSGADNVQTLAASTSQPGEAKADAPESILPDNEEDEKEEKPAIRTSFGRLVKRPAYMLNDVTEDELSDLGESSEDNYEELEVKPEILPEGEPGVTNEEVEEEDPAWSPGDGIFIDEKIGISATSGEDSEYLSDVSDVGGTSKTKKLKKESRVKKYKKPRTKLNKRKGKIRKVQSKTSGDVGYEVKVIQLDGTELMTINTQDENGIGLEPDITQKVMDSQAVIMVKNQLFGKRVQCPKCPRSFTDAARRDIHLKKTHEGIAKPFECHVCHKNFGRQDHLKNHMKRHSRPQKEKTQPKPRHVSSQKSHGCEFCDQSFRNKSELLVHTRLHTGEKPFKCEHCTESFISALKREFHIEQAHPEIPPYRCEFCPRAFFRQHRLRIHSVSHTGEKTNTCEICGKSFSQAAMLRYHQTTHEELHLKQFKCQECGRVFANPQNLKSHMESQHKKIYRHRCGTCNRGYTQMSHLRRHMRTHSGEQPFVCSYCPKKFTSGAALKIHVRIHTGERPYWCTQCEKGFRSKTKLGRHMKTLIHSGEKFKKDNGLTTEIGSEDVNAATSATWTEIVGIITGV